MAEVDLNSVATAGVDPITGSPLSKEVRQAIFNKTRISSSAFTSDSRFVSQYTQDNNKNLELIENNRQSLITLDSQIQNLNQQIVNLNSGLDKISTLLQEDSFADQKRINDQLEKERRYAEQKIRIGKENEVENKIQSAVLLPVQRIAPKVENIFDNTKRALLILFSGWLTNEIVKLFDAKQRGDTDSLRDIKNNILKHLGIAGGILLAINGGFSVIIKTMGTVITKVSSLIGKTITAPFKATADAAKSIFKKSPKTSNIKGEASATERSIASSAEKGIGSKVLSGTGKALTSVGGAALTTFFGVSEFKERKSEGQTNIEAGAGTAGSLYGSSLATGFASKLPLPPIIKFPLMIGAGIGGWMGGGKLVDTFTGANQPKLSEDVKSTSPPPLPQPKSSKEASVTSIIPPLSSKENNAPQVIQPSTNQLSATKIQPQTPLASEVANFSFGIDKSNQINTNFEGLESSFTSKNQPQEIENVSNNNKLSQSFFETQSQTSKKDDNKFSANIEPLQINNIPKQAPNIGTLPEPKPNVIVAQSSQPKNQMPIQSSSQSDESVTDIPLIKSSNPDNFYILYSQLNYNVVT
jgi:hypothetical protein